MAEFDEKLMDHEYDGIKELDNDLPRWWRYLFYFSIIWAVAYMLFYHVFSIGYLQEDQWRQEMDPNYVRQSAADTRFLGVIPEYHSPIAQQPGDITPRMLALAEPTEVVPMITRETDTLIYAALTDPSELAAGKEVFVKNCVQCHGSLAEGGIGPNLTDDYWLHEVGMTGVVKSIKYGYPAQGMISWRGFLSEDKILEVASYVLTLRGTNPPNAKAPQGELVNEYPD